MRPIIYDADLQRRTAKVMPVTKRRVRVSRNLFLSDHRKQNNALNRRVQELDQEFRIIKRVIRNMRKVALFTTWWNTRRAFDTQYDIDTDTAVPLSILLVAVVMFMRQLLIVAQSIVAQLMVICWRVCGRVPFRWRKWANGSTARWTLPVEHDSQHNEIKVVETLPV